MSALHVYEQHNSRSTKYAPSAAASRIFYFSVKTTSSYFVFNIEERNLLHNLWINLWY